MLSLNPSRYPFSFPTNRLCELISSSFSLRRGISFHANLANSGINRISLLRSGAMASSPPPVHVADNIHLTDSESQIFQLLLRVVRHFDLHTQLRVAGGWVRDKLLGKECYDIDIALDRMLGKELCEKVNEYFSSTGEEEHSVAICQYNPDQSKHLETAKMRLFNVSIDFVNLRSEDYSERSRIPTMTFGTPREDAFRRDLTINSLFYNINTGLVEDFTERGLEDLKFGRIVTPLPPVETFLDDPLRVLRALRFGARFGFLLDEELKKAASCDAVRAAIADKVSRERIGCEIDLMICGNQPVKAMAHICDLRLFWVVFSLPSEFESAISDKCDRLCIAYMDAAWNLMELVGWSTFNVDQRRIALYAALFLPVGKNVYRDSKAKKVPVVNHIILNSLKLKRKDAEVVMDIYNVSEKLRSLIPCISSGDELKVADIYWKDEIIDVPAALLVRVLCGLLVEEIKDHFRVALLISLLAYPKNIVSTEDFSFASFEMDKRRDLFLTVENSIKSQGLDRIWAVKGLVNGKDIMSVLQLKTNGPIVGEWLRKLRQWQLAYPSATAEEALDWLRETNSKRVKME